MRIDLGDIDFSDYPAHELLDLRVRLDMHLPQVGIGGEGEELSSLNLEAELVSLYHKLKLRLTSEADIKVYSAMTTLLKQLEATQASVYNTEWMKKLERTLLDTLRHESPELKERFLAEYRQAVSTT